VSTTAPRRTALAAAGLCAAVTLGVALPTLTAAPGRAAAPAAAAVAKKARPHVTTPLVFGHRGAAGYRPEHTLASYDLAVRMGADVIEPDLVSTKDHQLVARHENDITGTTDVSSRPRFAARRTTKTVDGVTTTGWFTEDFTLAELRTLRAKERLPQVRQENTIHDGRYRVPTLREVIDLAALESRRYGRPIGIAPETKHPTYFDRLGLSLEEPLVRELRDSGLDRRDSGVYLQSFETANLRELRDRFHLRVHLVQLTSAGPTARPYDHVASGNPQTYAQLTTRAGLRQVAAYADWLGPDKTQLFPRTASGATTRPTSLVRDAHAAGLQVVPYTYRAENQFLPAQDRTAAGPNDYGDLFAEIRQAYRAGVDGVFSDNPDLAFAAREDVLGASYGVEHPQARAR